MCEHVSVCVCVLCVKVCDLLKYSSVLMFVTEKVTGCLHIRIPLGEKTAIQCEHLGDRCFFYVQTSVKSSYFCLS